MRVLILFLVLCLSVNMAIAKKPFKKSSSITSGQAQIPVDDEFKTDFVGYDEKEYKLYLKEQKKLAKLEKKRAKLQEKKVRLELKKKKSLENQEYCKQYIEKLKSTEIEKRDINENL